MGHNSQTQRNFQQYYSEYLTSLTLNNFTSKQSLKSCFKEGAKLAVFQHRFSASTLLFPQQGLCWCLRELPQPGRGTGWAGAEMSRVLG